MPLWRDLGPGSWRTDTDRDYEPSINDLIHQQSLIGWNSFLEGCIGSHWRINQHNYFLRQNNRKSGHRWLVQLIRRVWKIPWALWNSRNQMEHLHDRAILIADLGNKVQDQINEGHGGIVELEPFFTENEISKVLPIKDIGYARTWLRNIRAVRRRDILRRGTQDELGRMRAVMRAFLRDGQ